VTAEGVETIEQARALRSMACHALQGYYFSMPVAAEAIPALLRRQWTFESPTADPRATDQALAAALRDH